MVNFINFLGANNFLSQCPRLGLATKSSMTLNPFEPLPIEMSLCNYENLLVLGASLFEYVRTEWILFKYVNHQKKNNWLRTTLIIKVDDNPRIYLHLTYFFY